MARLTIQNRHRTSSSSAELNGSPDPNSSSRIAESSAKRSRLNNGHAAPIPSQHQSGSQPDAHKPGSIVRVQLTNFVTYTSAEFYPGPSLNMVIGPNGTGKSTLVCAICLGLGWGSQHLGRAKELSEFVKHGSPEATIEIELARDPTRQETNPIFRRRIIREGNKSSFFIDGRSATAKSVNELCRSFSIQIDNLCQFLPQDRVVEFAALNPIDLLHSTQRAAAPEQMLQWHDNLKSLRAEQKKVQGQQRSDKETLANLDGRQQMLRGDVERLKERAEKQEKIRRLENARPFCQYRLRRNNHLEAKEKRNQGQAELKQLEKEVEPSLRAVNAKQSYEGLVKKATKERNRLVEKREARAVSLANKLQNMEDKQKDLETQMEAEKNAEKTLKGDVARIDGNISNLARRLKDDPPEFDPAAFNEKIRDKGRALAEIAANVGKIDEQIKSWSNQSEERKLPIQQAQRELRDLDSQAGQQGNKLKQISYDTSKAWEWIQLNQNKFSQRVYGPPVLECSVKDPKHVDAIESLFQKNDFLSFTCQSKEDLVVLSEQLIDRMGLSDITIHVNTRSLDEFRPPVNPDEMRRLGLSGWALDFMNGPEPVLAMLCGNNRLHQTGIVSGDISEAQFTMMSESAVSNWVTDKSSYSIVRRREYGSGATSTRVRPIRPGSIWTDQPVDLSAKRHIQQKIDSWTQEQEDLVQLIREADARRIEFRPQFEALQEEKRALAEDKAQKQKVLAEYNAIPDKIAQQKEKLEKNKEQSIAIKKRLKNFTDLKTELVMERGQVAAEYARSVDALCQAEEEYLKSEIILIEATSELETLVQRNRAVKEMLETRKREVDALAKLTEEARRAAKVEFDACKKVLAEGSAEDQEFYDQLPQEQTPEELEDDIASEQAALELIHEGNPNAIRDYEARQKTINKLRERVEKTDSDLRDLAAGIKEIRDLWEPGLDELIAKISAEFSRSFEKIGSAGEVVVDKPEDFDQWAILIKVKFRESESLQVLNAHRQSGGERAVSTVFYLMALQSLSESPFRVVDEINQGMDPRNERLVHEHLVGLACQEQTSQYFLITPKLLYGLKYHPRMKIHCIASGEYMPEEYSTLDFAKAIKNGRALKASLAV
ncbi:MAG: Structural maintenance of chromosomes protein 5 [Trizodia sp. TS-e1964]|nr:MAG: Structural maintenance of chromosomes protein 5 [Trizodia sp. TS-e1964]